MASGKPIPPRILTILSDDSWHSRKDIASQLGRTYGLGPSDLLALSSMMDRGQVTRRVTRQDGTPKIFEYQITEAGQAVLKELTATEVQD